MTERPLAILLAHEIILGNPDLRWLGSLARDYLKALGAEDFVTVTASLASHLRAARVREQGTA